MCMIEEMGSPMYRKVFNALCHNIYTRVLLCDIFHKHLKHDLILHALTPPNVSNILTVYSKGGYLYREAAERNSSKDEAKSKQSI